MKFSRLSLAFLAVGGSVALASSVSLADDFPGVSTLDSSFHVRGPMFSTGANVIFSGIDGNVNLGDHELWTSDGTVEGTAVLKDINPSGSSKPYRFTEFQDGWLFVADDGQTGFELWFTDGTSDGTRLVKDINPGAEGSWPGHPSKNLSSGATGDGLYVIDDVVYFWAFTDDDGGEPWMSDGSAAGTVMIEDLMPGADDGMTRAGPFLMTENGIVFPGKKSAGYDKVQSYDGSAVTTLDGMQLQYGLRGASVPGGSLAIVSVDASAGTELWATDGTAAGSTKLFDGGISESAQLGNTLIVEMQTDSGFQLWETDGTVAGSGLIKDINVQGNEEMLFLGTSDSHLFLLADDGTSGVEYWATDGTASGTQSLGDIRAGTDGQYGFAVAGFTIPPYFVDVENGLFYFAAGDGSSDGDFGTRKTLWVSDGTPEGTSEVTDEILNPAGFGYAGEVLVFGADAPDQWGSTLETGLYVARAGSDSALTSLRVGPVSTGPISGPPSDPTEPPSEPASLVPDFDPSVTEYSFALTSNYSAVTVDVQLSSAIGGPVECLVGDVPCIDPDNPWVGPTVDIDGPTFISIVVTAADGSSTTYRIAVSVDGVVPTTTTTTTAPPASDDSASSEDESASDDTASDESSTTTTTVVSGVVAPGEGAVSSQVTESNASRFVRNPGEVSLVDSDGNPVIGELVRVSDAVGSVPAGSRTAEQVAQIRSEAQAMVAALEERLPEGVSSPVSVVETESGANISGLVTDPADDTSDLPVPAEDVVLLVTEEQALLIGGADGPADPADVRNGVLEIGPDGEVSALAYGLTPGASGELVVMSSPTLLGTFTVGADGSFQGQAALPSTLAAGSHTVVLAADGLVASAGVVVTGGVTLPVTGGESSSVPWAVLVVAAGALAVLVIRRRVVV